MARTDWAQIQQKRRVQVKNDMLTTDKKRRAKCEKDKTMVKVVNWPREYGAGEVAEERSIIIILPRAQPFFQNWKK